MNTFIKDYIETKEDGHDFFPYWDFIIENDRVPTRQEIRDFIEANIDYTPTKLEMEAAIDYILDVDWQALLNANEG